MVPVDGAFSAPSQPALGTPSESASARGGRRFWLEAGLLAVVSGLLAWPGLLVLDGKFPVENLSVEMTNLIRNNRDDPVAWAQERMNRWTSLAKTAASCLSIFGGVFVGLAVVRDAATRWWSARRLLAGVCVGVVAGIVGGLAEATLVIRLERVVLDRLLLAALGHAVSLTCLGAAVAFLLPAARQSPQEWLSKLLKVFGGAVLASLVYAVVAAVVFPMQRSDLPIPEGDFNKLLFLIISAGVMWLACSWPGKSPLARSMSKVPDEVLPTPNVVTS